MKDSLPLAKGAFVLNTHTVGLVAIHKPPGIKSHPNRPGTDWKALLTAPYDQKTEAYQLETGSSLFLLHRLDSPTSGVVLLADSKELAQELKNNWNSISVKKEYHARVFGHCRQTKEIWIDRLEKKKEGNRVRITAGKGPKAESSMRRLSTDDGNLTTSVLHLQPHTGRTHQLRIQCAERNLPIVGDATYGDFSKNRIWEKETGNRFLHLHCRKMTITLPDGEVWAAGSPIPKGF